MLHRGPPRTPPGNTVFPGPFMRAPLASHGARPYGSGGITALSKGGEEAAPHGECLLQEKTWNSFCNS